MMLSNMFRLWRKPSRSRDKIVEVKEAAIYANERFINVITQTSGGLSRTDPQGESLYLDASPGSSELGEAVLRALRASRRLSDREYGELLVRERVLADYEDWVASLMGRFGYASRKALFKNMATCDVRMSEGLITISPSRHEKLEAWGGTNKKGADDVKVEESASASDIGEAVKLALSRCM